MVRKLADDDDERAELREHPALARALTETRAVLRKLSETWAPFSCAGTAECCQLAVTKRPPFLWPTEWRLLLDRLKRERRSLPSPRADGACPFLDAAGKRCTVYEDRPSGCRTFFCSRVRGPGQQPADTTNALLERLMKVNVALDPAAEALSILELAK